MNIVTGNIFNSRCQTLTIPVNTVGVAGAGLAKQWKERFPDQFEGYKEWCKDGRLRIGKPVLIKPTDRNRKWILLFPTKIHWRNPSLMEYIVDGLKFVQSSEERWGLTSIAVPPLGAGLGKLDEMAVRFQVFAYLGHMHGEYYK